MELSVEDLLAIPDKDAARIAGISMRRLRYWHKVGLVEPAVQKPRVSLYGFPEMIDLLVAATLRDQRNMSLQQVRKLVKHLRSRGYLAPLRELRFATIGKEIYVQHADGTWESDLRPDQTVLSEVIELEPLRALIHRSVQRDPATHGKVVEQRGVKAGKPIIAGTRIPVSAVQHYLEAGYDANAIIEEYPALTEADVEAVRLAC